MGPFNLDFRANSAPRKFLYPHGEIYRGEARKNKENVARHSAHISENKCRLTYKYILNLITQFIFVCKKLFGPPRQLN